jgi:hypothetical protein
MITGAGLVASLCLLRLRSFFGFFRARSSWKFLVNHFAGGDPGQ